MQELFETTQNYITYGLFGSSYVPVLYLAIKTLRRAKWKIKRIVSTVVLLAVYTLILICIGHATGIINIENIIHTFLS